MTKGQLAACQAIWLVLILTIKAGCLAGGGASICRGTLMIPPGREPQSLGTKKGADTRDLEVALAGAGIRQASAGWGRARWPGKEGV